MALFLLCVTFRSHVRPLTHTLNHISNTHIHTINTYSFKLNDMVEFIGIYSLDAPVPQVNNYEFQLQETIGLYCWCLVSYGVVH